MAQGLPLTTVGAPCGDTGDTTSDPLTAGLTCGVSRALRLVVRRFARVVRESGGLPVGEGAVGIMATTMKTMAATNRSRNHALRRMLEDRRQELMREVHGRIRDARTDIAKERQVIDQGESSEVDLQADIEFALIQMKAETAHKIDIALRRLNEDSYGVCFECGDAIAERRLRALPFAVRCKNCEEARETVEYRERIAARRGSSPLHVEMSG
jgi:DnaK suppressor protein